MSELGTGFRANTSGDAIAASFGAGPIRELARWHSWTALTLLYAGLSVLAAETYQSETLATPGWPAAGLAVAAVLLLGPKSCPYIALGSWLGALIAFPPAGAAAAAVIGLVGVGAAAQAWLGAYLVRRFVQFPDQLLRTGDVIRYMLLAGPVSCLLNASFATAVQRWFGVVPPERWLHNMVLWWSGDVIGVAVALPVIWGFFGAPARCWRPRIVGVGLPMTLAFLVSVWVDVQAAQSFERAAVAEAEVTLQTLAADVRTSVDQAAHSVAAVAALYSSSESVTDSELGRFVAATEQAESRVDGLWVVDAERRVIAHPMGEDAPLPPVGPLGDVRTPLQIFGALEAPLLVGPVVPPHRDGAAWIVAQLSSAGPSSLAAALGYVACVTDGVELECEGRPTLASVPISLGNRVVHLAVARPGAAGTFPVVPSALWSAGLLLAFATLLLALTGRNLALGAEAALRADAESRLATLSMQLARANAELDAFARTASHDLRAPLRAISSLAAWVLEDAGDKLNERSTEHLRLVVSRAERLDAMIVSLLDYARAGRSEHPRESFTLADVVAEVTSVVDADVVVGPAPPIVGHRTPLRVVLHNLIGNAVKHGSDGVRVEVRAEEVGTWLAISVLDDGPGIAPKFRASVFDPFTTLRSRDQVEGSGMGLAITKRIVLSEGGTISVQESPSGGACFRFTWPLGHPDESGGGAGAALS